MALKSLTTPYTLKTLDEKCAMQIPNEVINAGLEPNTRFTVTEKDESTVEAPGSYVLVK